MADEIIHEGGCLCGQVRYRITGPIESVAHCHCSMCRRASGAPVVTWASVPIEAFAFTRGEPAIYKSSDHAERHFCAGCGAQLTFSSSRGGGDVDVTLGTLDHAEDHATASGSWTDGWTELLTICLTAWLVDLDTPQRGKPNV